MERQKAFQSFIKDPASQINKLNVLLPDIIQIFAQDAKQATKMVS